MSDLTPQQKILNQIAATRAGINNRRIISAMLTDDIHDVISAAAKTRGISKGAYLRRAAAAFAAFDLGLRYEDVMETEVAAHPHGVIGGDQSEINQASAGQGFGLWTIEGLR